MKLQNRVLAKSGNFKTKGVQIRDILKNFLNLMEIFK